MLPIADLELVVGESVSMDEYIVDPEELVYATEVTGLTAAVAYDALSRLLTPRSAGNISGVRLIIWW